MCACVIWPGPIVCDTGNKGCQLLSLCYVHRILLDCQWWTNIQADLLCSLEVNSCFGIVLCFRVLFTSVSINLRQRGFVYLSLVQNVYILTAFLSFPGELIGKRRVNRMCHNFSAIFLVPGCRVIADKLSDLWFYHNSFLSFTAGNTVCFILATHYLTLSFSCFWCLHTHFCLYNFNIAVTDLSKLSYIRDGFSL